MRTLMTALELVVIFCLPALVLFLAARFRFLKAVGAVAICYAAGFVLALLPIPYDKNLSELVASVAVALAIPLILFGFDLGVIRRLARPMLIGFCLMALSALLASSVTACVASRVGLENAPALAGMAAGLYTGGTPNLIAVGHALLRGEGAEASSVITAANTADFAVGGVWFLLVLTVGKKVYERLLGQGRVRKNEERETLPADTDTEDVSAQIGSAQNEFDFSLIPRDKKSILKLVGAILLAVLVLGIGAGLEMLVNGNLDGSLFIMITVSVLGIVVGFIRPVREVKGTYQVGQYLVLTFSVGLSMSIDPSVLVRDLLPMLAFFAAAQILCAVLHLILCRIAGLDAHTALITCIAGIYGPPFIAPTADVCGDRSLIAPGVICGVTGLVIGNLLGIGIGSLWTMIL